MGTPIPELELVCEPGDEPDVTEVAAQIFVSGARIAPPANMDDLRKDAIACRELALILAGFIHEPWANSYGQEEAEWYILLQYQRMPVKSKLFKVLAQDKDTAVEMAQALCGKEFKCNGIVQQINGNNITEEAK